MAKKVYRPGEAYQLHEDFLPLLEAIRDKLTTVKKIILITDEGKKPETKINIDMEYEEMLKGAAPSYDFPDLDENTSPKCSSS